MPDDDTIAPSDAPVHHRAVPPAASDEHTLMGYEAALPFLVPLGWAHAMGDTLGSSLPR